MPKKAVTKQVLPLRDAQLAADISALRDQLLTIRVRISNRPLSDKTVIAHLVTASIALGNAMDAALTLKKA